MNGRDRSSSIMCMVDGLDGGLLASLEHPVLAGDRQSIRAKELNLAYVRTWLLLTTTSIV